MSNNTSPADKSAKSIESSNSLSITTAPDASIGETSTNFPSDKATVSDTTLQTMDEDKSKQPAINLLSDGASKRRIQDKTNIEELELLMSELESLFDRPNIVQPLDSGANLSQGSKMSTTTNQ